MLLKVIVFGQEIIEVAYTTSMKGDHENVNKSALNIAFSMALLTGTLFAINSKSTVQTSTPLFKSQLLKALYATSLGSLYAISLLTSASSINQFKDNGMSIYPDPCNYS